VFLAHLLLQKLLPEQLQQPQQQCRQYVMALQLFVVLVLTQARVVARCFITQQQHSRQRARRVIPTAITLKLHRQINHLALFGQLQSGCATAQLATTKIVNSLVSIHSGTRQIRQTVARLLQPLAKEWRIQTKFMVFLRKWVWYPRAPMGQVLLGHTQTTQKLIGFCHQNLS
jgi:hypothetical protein